MIDPAAYRRLQPALYHLEGVRCRLCAAAYVGKRHACAACGHQQLETVRFSGHGRIVACTTVTKPPQDHTRRGAYTLALIELQEGPRVLAKTADTLSRPPVVGAAVNVVIRRLYEPGAEEMICYGYKFQPAWPENT